MGNKGFNSTSETEEKTPNKIEILLKNPGVENLKKIFHQFDKDASGYLDRNEFTLFMIELDKFLEKYLNSIQNSNDYEDIQKGILFSKEVVGIENFQSIQKEHEDKISFDEFQNHVKKVFVQAKTETN